MKLQRTAAHASPAMAATKGKPAPSAAKKAAGAPAKKMRARNGEDRLEMIRQQAYFLFTSRNGADGSDFDDWLRAEAMVDQLLTKKAPANRPVA